MGRFANIDTRDPDVFVTTWFLVVVAVLSVLIRVATKCRVFRQLTSDDYLIIAALVRTLHRQREPEDIYPVIFSILHNLDHRLFALHSPARSPPP